MLSVYYAAIRKVVQVSYIISTGGQVFAFYIHVFVFSVAVMQVATG